MTYAGAFAGSRDDLKGTSSQNPKGFFELIEMRDVCDDILHAADADWWKIASLSLARVPHEINRSVISRAKKIISKLSENLPWIMKEPRLCLVLPLVRRATENPIVIHIYRNPVEVAKSLRLRNGFSIAHGLALWEAYNRAAIENSEDLPCIKVRYRDLLERPVETTNSLVTTLRELGVAGLREPDPKSLEDRQCSRPCFGLPRFCSTCTFRGYRSSQCSL